MKKKVSIVVPVYNAEKYVAECIESLINQTYKEIEIVLVNDGSRDNSIELLKKYQQKDSRIVIIDRENKGSIYSRLEGVQKSTGDYIIFVDADDWIELDTVEKTLQIAEKYDADIVRFNMIREHISEGVKSKIDGPYKKELYVPKEKFERNLYSVILNTYGCNPICGQLIKKETIKDVKIKNDDIKMGDDLLTNLEIYKNINNIVFTNYYLYHYRETEDSITTTVNTKKILSNIKDTYEVYSKFYEMIKLWNMDTEENKEIISKRILNELVTVLNTIFVSNMKKKEKIEIVKYARELLDINFKVNKNTLTKLEKLFLERQYNTLIKYATIKIKIPHLIKKQIRSLLRSINKLGGGTK